MMDAMDPLTSWDPDLLSVLACPICHTGVTVNKAAGELRCSSCARGYPVRDGVPVLLTDHARMATRDPDEKD